MLSPRVALFNPPGARLHSMDRPFDSLTGLLGAYKIQPVSRRVHRSNPGKSIRCFTLPNAMFSSLPPVSRLFKWCVAVLAIGIPQVLPAQEQAPIESRSDLRQRIIEKTNESDFVNSLRMSLLSAVAFYPDEVIAAIFEAAQDPEALSGEKPSEDPEFKKAHEFLSASPEILDKMAQHPVAVRILGEMAKNNLEHTWKLIDDLRAQYREKAGAPVAEAVTARDEPPPVKLNAQGKAEGDVEGLTVVLKSGNKAYVKDEKRPGFVFVYSATDTKEGKVAVVEKVIKQGGGENQGVSTSPPPPAPGTAAAGQGGVDPLSDPANWEPSEEALSGSSGGFRESQVSSPEPRTTYRKPSPEAWDYYSAPTEAVTERPRGRYRRTQETADSREVYSGRSIDPYVLDVALERALFHQVYVFDTFDSGGFQGPGDGSRGGSGFQGPGRSGRSPYGGFQGQGDGLEFR